MTNRRNLFRAAGLAGAAALFPASHASAAEAKTAASAASAAARILEGGVEVGAPLPGIADMTLSRTFGTGKSVLNDGVVMNASHWGVYKVHVKGGRIERQITVSNFIRTKGNSLLLVSH